MTYIQAISLVVNASTGIFAWFKRQKADKLVEEYLKDKYKLSSPGTKVWATSMSYGESKVSFLKDDWATVIGQISDSIQNHQRVDESFCELCADLALFITIVHRHEMGCAGSRLYDALIAMHGGETHKSLLEMGRGRGGDYALTLIQRELKERVGGRL